MPLRRDPPAMWIISTLVLIHATLAQEKFTLLKNSPDNANVREIKVGSTTTKTATSKALPTTKVPYKTFQCPPEPMRIPFFSPPCNFEKDCRVFGANLACCKQRCIKGVLMATASPKRAAETPPASNATLAPLPLVCPSPNLRLPLFSLPCARDADCDIFGRRLLCCRRVCLQGVAPPKEEVRHEPTLFGLVERRCATQPLAELFDVRECDADVDCTPRICCPERGTTTPAKSYCRTPVHHIAPRLPGAQRIQEPLRNFVSYMQCTPPPPRELFPKPCNNTLDCFPNLCCQESGKKFCRPPKRSLVALVADVTTVTTTC